MTHDGIAANARALDEALAQRYAEIAEEMGTKHQEMQVRDHGV